MVAAIPLRGAQSPPRVRPRFGADRERRQRADIRCRRQGTRSQVRKTEKGIAPSAQLEIPERDVNFTVGGGDVARQIALARSQPQFIRVSFEDISVTFSDDDTALVTADVLFKGTSELYGFSGRDTRELDATMRRSTSGDWLFASIRLKPVIEK